MGLKAGLNLAEQIAKYAKACGKTHILQTLPQDLSKIDTCGLKLAKPLVGDVAHFTETTFKKPSAERLKELLENAGIKDIGTIYKSDGSIANLGDLWGADPYINNNNSLFLEKLLELFPKKAEETVNTAVQKRMIYLSDIDHSGFADKHKFLEQFLKDVDEVENIVAKDGTKLYGDWTTNLYSKKAILQAKYNNLERYQELTDLISLHKKGLVPRHNVEIFFPEGHFHPLIKGDMKKLLSGESYYLQFEKLSKEAISQLEHGEAFSVGEKMFVKTLDGFEELKIDKTTYEKLFPAIERYSISQGQVNDCVKVASYNALIKNPTSRVEIYKMFEQLSDGIKVNIPYGRKKIEYIFKWSDLNMLNTEQNIQGGLGHKMLEYTYDIANNGCLRTEFGTPESIDLVKAFTNKMTIPTTSIAGTRAPKDKELRQQFFEKHNNGIYISHTGSNNFNIGFGSDHACSFINLNTGERQNPWTGIEVFYGKALSIYDGAFIDL